MGIEDLFLWYQQKIGTYDKQQWETKIEQREQRIYGLTHVQLRSTKPNTDLIDLDLVRGSSFTKAKSQQGFLKVAKHATLRCILVPFYGKWWIQQTSKSIFLLSLILYLTLIFNIVIYYIYSSKPHTDSEGISWMEIMIPFLIMWVLSLIHSQIVATNPLLDDKKKTEVKSRQYSKRRRSNLRQHRSRLDKIKDTKKIPKKLKFNDIICVDANPSTSSKLRSPLNLRGHIKGNIDDDGFESLNGNGSRTSEEEIIPLNNPSQQLEVTDSPKKSTLKKLEPDLKVVEKSSQKDALESSSECAQSQQIVKAVDISEENEDENNSDSNCNYCDSKESLSNVSDTKNVDISNCNSCDKCENWVKQLQNDVPELSRSIIVQKNCTTESDDSEDDASRFSSFKKQQQLAKRRSSHIPTINITSTVDSTCDTEDEILSSPGTGLSPLLLGEAQSSTEWIGVTTNSEDCSYSSDIDDVSDAHVESNPDYFLFDNDMAPTSILNPPTVKVSCTIWEDDELKKADLSMLEISSAIIGKVDAMTASMDYFYVGMVFSTILAFLPIICRLFADNSTENLSLSELYKNLTSGFLNSNNLLDTYQTTMVEIPKRISSFLDISLGSSVWEKTINIVSLLQRWVLSSIVFFLLCVAERTFKQRLLYAKLFSHLTSSRRAKKSELPHFRLNKVRNIKTWLSVRSYLKKRGPQRSVDIIVSTAFIVTLLLLICLCVELLKDSVSYSQYYLEALTWCLGLGVLLLRFMTLGTKINRKYRNLSVLITEQINLHLQMEQKPHKKDELAVANNVLKLAIDLLKELENPFKISGLSANPILYNVTKLVILSALSGVLSEMLGFKLKLHKIKLK